MAVIQGDVSKIIAGLPIMVEGCNIAITQPKVRDICAFGEDDFFTAIFFFTKEEKVAKEIKLGNSQLERLSDFQILMMVLEEDKNIHDSVFNLFQLIFPSYNIQLDAGSINFRLEEQGKIVGQLNPMNFSSFKKMLEQLFVPASLIGQDEPDYNPVNDKAAEIAAKLKAGREKAAAAKEEAKGNQDKQYVFGPFASILSIGLAIDINIFFDYTPFQLFDAYIRFSKKRAYDFYERVSTMPFMDVSKMDAPEDWSESNY